LRSDGTVWAWGRNSHGELGDGSNIIHSVIPIQVQNLNNIIAISAKGNRHTLAIRNDGTVWAWGSNLNGQIGDGSYGHANNHLVPIQVLGENSIGYFNVFADGQEPPSVPSLGHYFMQGAQNYNHDLAIWTAELSLLAYGRDNNGEGTNPEPIRTHLENLGFRDFVQENYTNPSNNHTVAYTIARRTTVVHESAKNVIVVAIRGTVTDEENISNIFAIGSEEVHVGFGAAMADLRLELTNYIIHHGLFYNPENNIILITGHSRGGAVANLLAADLNEREHLAHRGNIFTYTFAAPNSTRIPR